MMSAAGILGAAKYVAIAKFLSPRDLGYYGLVLLVLPFGVYVSNWGSLHALNVELPAAYAGDARQADGLAERAFGFVLVSTTSTCVVYLAVVLTVPIADSRAKTALALAAATIFLNTLSEFFILILRVRRRLPSLGAVSLLRAGTSVGLASLGAWLFGYSGAITFEFLALGTAITAGMLLTHWLRPRRPIRTEVRRLVPIGVPLLIADVVLALRLTLDRFFVASSLSTQFGQYTLASLITVAFAVVYGILSQAIFPQLLFERAQGLSFSALGRRIRLMTCALLLGGAALAPFFWIGTSWIRDHGLERYSTGIAVMRILYVGGCLSLVAIYSVILLAARRFHLVMSISATAAGAGLATGAIVAATRPSLNGFAWTFVATQLIAALGFVAAGEREVRRQRDPNFQPPQT